MNLNVVLLERTVRLGLALAVATLAMLCGCGPSMEGDTEPETSASSGDGGSAGASDSVIPVNAPGGRRCPPAQGTPGAPRTAEGAIELANALRQRCGVPSSLSQASP